MPPRQTPRQNSQCDIKMQLNILQPSEAERTLGVRLAPNGNEERQLQYAVKVAKARKDLVRTGHLPRHLVWRSWRKSIMKTLELQTSLYQIFIPSLSADIMRIHSRTTFLVLYPSSHIYSDVQYHGHDINLGKEEVESYFQSQTQCSRL